MPRFGARLIRGVEHLHLSRLVQRLHGIDLDLFRRVLIMRIGEARFVLGLMAGTWSLYPVKQVACICLF